MEARSKETVSRRSFVVGVGAAAGAVAGLAALRVAEADELDEGAEETSEETASDWLGEEPETPETFDYELEADVVVCGLGYAGVCATRGAAEEGASVIVFEKGGSFGLGSKNFAAFGSQKWLELFPECAEYWEMTSDLVNAVSKACAYRNNARLMKRWAELNGETFDWYTSAPENVEWGSAENGNEVSDEAEYSVTETTYPFPANYNPLEENIPCFPGTGYLIPSSSGGFMEANIARAQEASSVEIYRNTRAIKLITDEGRVVGVIAQDDDGAYYKATAAKGVVLATGDFLNNEAMVQEFVPQVLVSGYEPNGTGNWYTVKDGDGMSCNTGDGHRMAVWAGAKMQDYGCVMSHCVSASGSASGVFGTLPFLQLNVRGERFFNEDVQGQQFAEQIRMQPQQTSYQFFDGAWESQMADMPYGHGKLPTSTTQEAIDAAVENGYILKADTVEELCALIENIDADAAVASIERYNELCAAGDDVDFGKTPKRLFGLTTPPYYVITYGKGDDLVTMSGIESDDECRALDSDYDVVPGLYLAGNVQGGRFADIYPEVLQGHSIAMAATFGRLAGQNAANAI